MLIIKIGLNKYLDNYADAYLISRYFIEEIGSYDFL